MQYVQQEEVDQLSLIVTAESRLAWLYDFHVRILMITDRSIHVSSSRFTNAQVKPE